MILFLTILVGMIGSLVLGYQCGRLSGVREARILLEKMESRRARDQLKKDEGGVDTPPPSQRRPGGKPEWSVLSDHRQVTPHPPNKTSTF
jgi:hypothetical protein